jgi:hypothetical protein
MSRPPPPSSAPAISRESVEVVKRKIAAPSGPPPAGMSLNFSAPKSLPTTNYSQAKSSARGRYEDDEDLDESRDQDFYREDDEDGGYTYGGGYGDEDEEYYSEEENRNGRRANGGEKGPGQNQDYLVKKPLPAPNSYERDSNYENLTNHDGTMYSFQKHLVTADGKQPHMMKAAMQQQHTLGVDNKAQHKDDKATGNTKKLALFNFHPILRSTYRDLKAFVSNPCPPNVITRCYIERNRSGSKMLAPYFSLCADLEGKQSNLNSSPYLKTSLKPLINALYIDGTGRELMVCRKVMQSRSSHYVFSLKAEDLWRKREERSRLYLGKLRSVSNNDYVLYDNGICAAPDEPEELLDALQRDEDAVNNSRDTILARKAERDAKAAGGGTEDVSLYRRELCVIHFNTKKRAAQKEIRAMEVCVPALLIAEADRARGQQATLDADSKNSSSPPAKQVPAVYNLMKPFEKIRKAGRQNELHSKTCLIFHEKSSRFVV